MCRSWMATSARNFAAVAIDPSLRHWRLQARCHRALQDPPLSEVLKKKEDRGISCGIRVPSVGMQVSVWLHLSAKCHCAIFCRQSWLRSHHHQNTYRIHGAIFRSECSQTWNTLRTCTGAGHQAETFRGLTESLALRGCGLIQTVARNLAHHSRLIRGNYQERPLVVGARRQRGSTRVIPGIAPAIPSQFSGH